MAPTIPVLDSRFKRNKVTMAQINDFENAAMNGLRPDRRPFSPKYRELLVGRRARPVAKDTGKILAALQANQTVVVASPTGSGKTTEIPQVAMFNEFGSQLLVACTQPRRLAATSVAQFVAQQRDVEVGEEVGYKVRFDNKTTPDKTRLQYMTDGMLLQEIQSDHILSKYGCIIIDEAHERSLSTDLLLPLVRVALGKRRDLKLIIMSATIDAMKFRMFFKGPDDTPAPYLEIGGASHPVKLWWNQSANDINDYVDGTVWAVADFHKTNPLNGDILAFLPGEDDIGAVAKALAHLFPDDLQVIPVYSLLSDQKQQEVFKTVEGKRKVVLATNIAETSLTIDGIVCVIDCGKSKQTSFEPRMRAEKLDPLPISRASAMQRLGRAGRTAPGQCYRLYTESAWNTTMEMSTVPEIKRSDLTEVVLRLMAMGYGSTSAVWTFGFVDRPDPEVFYAAFGDLEAMGYLDDKGLVNKALATQAVQFPIYPGWYQAIRKANELKCIDAVVSIAAVMSTQASIFFRSKSLRVAADEVCHQFWHPLSDHLACLNAFNAYKQARQEGHDMSRWCRDNFINYKSVQEALQLENQLISICIRVGMKPSFARFTVEDDCTNVRKAIAFGFCHRVAIVTDPTNGNYMQSHYPWDGLLAADSCLTGFKDTATSEETSQFEWIVYDKFTQTLSGKTFFQSATVIDVDWLIDLPHFHEDHIPALSTNAKKMQRVAESLQRARAQRAGKD